MSQNLSITQAGAVARITLTQPEIRNAFSDEVIAELELMDATWAGPGDDRVTGLPVLDRTGWIDGGPHRYGRAGFELPAQGVALPVRYGGALLGTLLLRPAPGVGTSPDQRSVAVALADLLAAELSHRTSPGTSPVG